MGVLLPRTHSQSRSACPTQASSTWFTPETTSAQLEGSVAQQVVSVHLKLLGLKRFKANQIRPLRYSHNKRWLMALPLT